MLTYQQYQWWQRFIDDPEKILNELSSHQNWFLSDVQPYAMANHITPQVGQQSELAEVIAKELEMPEVYCGPLRRNQPASSHRVASGRLPLTVGSMVHYRLKDEEMARHIGRVADIGERIKVERYKGSITTVWIPETGYRKRPILIEKQQIVGVFKLTPSARLPAHIVRYLKMNS